jgi:hypothetical protein
MLSDTLFDAIQEIEDYQRAYPDIYDGHKDHVEIVKKVMASLQGILDECPRSYPVNFAATLSEDQKAWFRLTCEAQIARWVECLRMLGPVTGEELVKKLADAIQRQDAVLAQRVRNEDQEPAEEDDDNTTPENLEGKETRTFRARWCGHCEIEARTKEEAFDIHAHMAAEDILKQPIFNGIEE